MNINFVAIINLTFEDDWPKDKQIPTCLASFLTFTIKRLRLSAQRK